MLAGRVSASGDDAERSVDPCPPGMGDNTGIGPRAVGRAGRGGGTAQTWAFDNASTIPGGYRGSTP